jgi:hypothetical protein
MRSLFVFIFFLGFSFKGYAQHNYVSGVVINSMTGHQVIRAMVITVKNDSITGRFFTDSLGTFKIPVSSFLSCAKLEITASDYEKLVYDRKVLPNDLSNFNVGSLYLIPNGIALKEVEIKRGRKYRDTINIDLSKVHFDRSFMIGDFLSGEKGFYKNGEGKLFFKGKEVSDIVLNDGTFFGKNNLEIFRYLPSLTLNNIEVTETNIDSLTNTVMLNPKIKVNLKLKEEFKKGKFGSATAGYGTASRYLLASDLYKYNKNEQISLVLNSNNINSGDNPFSEPNVSFSPSGNNTINKSAKLGYRNLFYENKIEIEASIKGRFENTKFNSELWRQEETVDKFSKTSNTSSVKSFNLESTNLNLTYRLNPLNTINFRQTIDYNKTRSNDSLYYEIRSDNQNSLSQVNKDRDISTFSSSNSIQYLKRFSDNRGRTVYANVNSGINKYNTGELSKVFGLNDLRAKRYFIDGNRTASKRILALETGFTEPLGESGYVNFIINYKDERFDYDSRILSDSVSGFDHDLSRLSNQYLQPGIKFQKTFKKWSIDAELMNNINFRAIREDLKTDKQTLYNLNINGFIDYKLNIKNNLSLRYITTTNYPNIGQLTPIHNSFDLVSQVKGNLYLKPEVGRRVELIYNLRKTDSLNFTINAAAELFKSKFGFNVNNQPGSYQINYIDNIGSSRSYDLSFSMYKILRKGHDLSYRLSLNRTETPVITNEMSTLNSGMTVNQSLSSGFFIHKLLTTSPVLSSTYTVYEYATGKSKLYSLTYSDKISLVIPKVLNLNIYPIVNYAYNINSNLSWAINGEIKRDFLKKYATIWIKAYDIFNSFSYTNNYLGASYSQSLKYSNLSRYILIGASIKFNNMK